MGIRMEASGIQKGYPLPEGGKNLVLKGIDLTIPEKSLVIIKGRSGSGKTTLLNLLGALERPDEGHILYDGLDLATASEKEITMLRRRRMGFVFQAVALVPSMSVGENVEFAIRLAEGAGRHRQADREERVRECLNLVGLGKRIHHMPQELSGGEQQRCAIARAMAHRPEIILADEPTGELDFKTALAVVNIFRDMVEKEGVTVIMTTHDTAIVELGNIVYEIEDGELVHE